MQFGVNLEKPTNMSVGNGFIKIYTKKSSSDNEIQQGTSETVLSISWGGNETTESYFTSFSVPLDASDYNTNGGKFFARYISSSDTEYNSCQYSIEKDEVPTFTLSPSSVTLSCGSTSSRTFTVTPANIPSGANVTYAWSFNGWSPVSSTTTSRTLEPNSGVNLPSNVSVTPSINGVAQTTQTSTVSRGDFSPTNYQITGDNSVCDIGTYTIANLPSTISITSVSTSNPNIATASLNANDEIIVTKVADGLVTISAVIENACGQTDTITKVIEVGIPTSINATLTGAEAVCGIQSYTYTLSGANHPCISTINWSVSSNLSFVPINANSIQVTRNTSAVDPINAGLITASIAGTDVVIEKGIWVGLPNNTTLSIQQLGSYDFFAGRWTKLKANYTPLMYEATDQFNLSFDWQIPNSQIRNFPDTAYKDVNPNNLGPLNVGVRVVCDCGNGDWVYRIFNVTSAGGGFNMN